MKLSIDLSSWKVWIFIFCLGFLYYMVFHFSVFASVQTEILRLSSPDGKLDAVYVQSGAGAMASGSYLVYIVPKGHQPNKTECAVFWGKNTCDLDLSWEDDRRLLVKFSKSDVKHYQSYIYPFPQDAKYKVEIQCAPTPTAL